MHLPSGASITVSQRTIVKSWGSLRPPRGSQEWNPRLQAWQQVPLTGKPPFQPSNVQLLHPNVFLIMKEDVTAISCSITTRTYFACHILLLIAIMAGDTGGGRRATLRVGSLCLPFIWVLNMEFRLPGSHSKRLYWLSHLKPLT